MKTSVKSAIFVTLSAAVFTLGASATLVSPGSGAVSADSISVTDDGLVQTGSGTVQSGGASVSYTETVINDGSNYFGANDLTFLLTVSSATGSSDITAVSLKDGFDNLSELSVGYIAGPGEDGTSVPTKIAENANGVVDFRFPGTDAIAGGTGTEYLVIQTPFTSLPSGTANDGLGTVSITAGTAAVTPEPASLTLMATGLVAAGLLLSRRRVTV